MIRSLCLTLLALLPAASVIAQSSTTPATHGVDSTVLQNLPSLGVEDSSAAALGKLSRPQIGTAQNIDDAFGSSVWSTAADELLTSLKKSLAFKATDFKKLTDLEKGKTARQRFTIRLAVLEQLAEHAQ